MLLERAEGEIVADAARVTHGLFFGKNLTSKIFLTRLFNMTDQDRNIRTLALCFVLAILALIPLRFAEISQRITSVSAVQVLGDTVTTEEVILPNAELSN